MQEIQITNLSLRYLIEELRPSIEGSFVNKIQFLPNNWLKIRLNSRQGSKSLIVSDNAFYFTQFQANAKQESRGFAEFANKHLNNRIVRKFYQHGFERIAVLEFDEFFLILELFGSGNIILADKSMKILFPKKTESWSARTLKRGEQYLFPPERGLSPENISGKNLSDSFSKSGADLIRALVKTVNLAPVFLEEILFRLKIEKSKKAQAVSSAEAEKIAAEMKKLCTEISLKKLRPVLAERNSEQLLLPFPVSLPETKTLKEFSSMNSALDELFSSDFFSEKSPETESKQKGLLGLEKSLEQQLELLEKLSSESVQMKKNAEFIYAHYSGLQELMQKAKELSEKKEIEKLSFKAEGFHLTKADPRKKFLELEIEG